MMMLNLGFLYLWIISIMEHWNDLLLCYRMYGLQLMDRWTF